MPGDIPPLFIYKSQMYFLLLLLPIFAFAIPKTICGGDDRTFSNVKEVGRAVKPEAEIGCTLTMIGKSCAVSAGHCWRDLQIIQFNMYLEKEKLISSAEDTYLVDQDAKIISDVGEGRDWAVVRLQRNTITGAWPGDIQGSLPVNMTASPQVGDEVSVTGFGWISTTHMKNSPQQSHIGRITSMYKSIIGHEVDTMGGNSGSSLVNAQGEIIGIHTHGGCSPRGGHNKATLLYRSESFKKAIHECLEWEKTNL
jgi:V8-like Glu-specific endopeptidase